jgi:hypothetical protein
MKDIIIDESLSGLMAHAGSLNKEIVRNEKLNVQRALEIGRTLAKARTLCAIGQWTEELAKAGISRQRASECIRGAEAPPAVQAAWESVRDMTRWLAGNSGHAGEGTSGAGRTGQRESESTPGTISVKVTNVPSPSQPKTITVYTRNSDRTFPARDETAVTPPEAEPDDDADDEADETPAPQPAPAPQTAAESPRVERGEMVAEMKKKTVARLELFRRVCDFELQFLKGGPELKRGIQWFLDQQEDQAKG